MSTIYPFECMCTYAYECMYTYISPSPHLLRLFFSSSQDTGRAMLLWICGSGRISSCHACVSSWVTCKCVCWCKFLSCLRQLLADQQVFVVHSCVGSRLAYKSASICCMEHCKYQSISILFVQSRVRFKPCRSVISARRI